MTRREYLNELYHRLGGSMPQEEAEQHLTYYAEMLADRMEEGMSEEEAVSSMEDVETVAGRILQDRAESGGAPPNCPDPPARQASPSGSGDAFNGSGAAAPKKKRRWILPVAITAAAVIAALGLRSAVGAIFGLRYGVTINDEGIYVGDSIAVDSNGIRVGGLEIGPDGIRMGGASEAENEVTVVDEGIIEEAVMGGGDSLTFVGVNQSMYSLDPAGISKISVEWKGGTVNVETIDDGNEMIRLEENSDYEMNDDTRMHYEIDGDELKISFAKKDKKLGDKSKWLYLGIPRTVLEKLTELDIETVSADVYATQVSVPNGELSVETVSGGVYCENQDGFTRELSLKSVSGEICYYGSTEKLEMHSTSGEIYYGDGDDSLREVEVGSVSGDVYLYLRDAGFSLAFETTSGSLYSTPSLTSYKDGHYVYGDPSCEIEVETVSGDLSIGFD